MFHRGKIPQLAARVVITGSGNGPIAVDGRPAGGIRCKLRIKTRRAAVEDVIHAILAADLGGAFLPVQGHDAVVMGGFADQPAGEARTGNVDKALSGLPDAKMQVDAGTAAAGFDFTGGVAEAVVLLDRTCRPAVGSRNMGVIGAPAILMVNDHQRLLGGDHLSALSRNDPAAGGIGTAGTGDRFGRRQVNGGPGTRASAARGASNLPAGIIMRAAGVVPFRSNSKRQDEIRGQS